MLHVRIQKFLTREGGVQVQLKFFCHQLISLRRSNIFSVGGGGSEPVFLRKPIATCAFVISSGGGGSYCFSWRRGSEPVFLTFSHL